LHELGSAEFCMFENVLMQNLMIYQSVMWKFLQEKNLSNCDYHCWILSGTHNFAIFKEFLNIFSLFYGQIFDNSWYNFTILIETKIINSKHQFSYLFLDFLFFLQFKSSIDVHRSTKSKSTLFYNLLYNLHMLMLTPRFF
jgi:hypothetical protein